MAAIKVKGNFEEAWQNAHGRAARRSRRQDHAAREQRQQRFPGGRMEGEEPYASACEKLADLTAVTIREWRDDGAGFAYLGSPDRAIDAPRPVDAETAAVFCHECLHHAGDRSGAARERGASWESEVNTWRAALRWFQEQRLPGVDVAAERAVECLRTRGAARKYGPHTLARVIREPVGDPIRATPQPSIHVYSGGPGVAHIADRD